ncbi:MAG: sigma-54-dependent Fis family transcriptional regulator [Planctomycetes bacterium]|nr:sigma-54-dependent Fis family transcriptional regulator [Planctomycetota bacterium]
MTIVIVEDTAAHRVLLKQGLSRDYANIVEFSSAPEALDYVKAHTVDLVISDYMMPRMDGVEFLRRIKTEVDRELPVIVATAFSSIENAVDVFKLGASDYIPKPYNFKQLLLSMEKLLRERRLVLEVRRLRRELEEIRRPDRPIGKAPAFVALLSRARAVASSAASVLITGEPGTGKDRIAREIHLLSPRRDGPLVPVNCAALPENLLESELFGHEKGAFTGADTEKKGLVEAAQSGTLFLDEIGAMPAPLQAKLLHLLQDGSYRRVGSTVARQANARIVSATNGDLTRMVAEGKFRSDLYYRLLVVPIVVPPLRERKEDVPLLLHHFMEIYARRDGKKLKGYFPEAMQAILAYDWPGNVRELENFVERTAALAPPDEEWSNETPLATASPVAAFARPAEEGVSTFADEKKQVVEKFEREYLIRVLAAAGGNVSKAADMADKNRSEFHSLLKRYGLKSKDFKKGGAGEPDED